MFNKKTPCIAKSYYSRGFSNFN